MTYWLATHDARRLNFHTTGLRRVDRSLAVDGFTQRVDHTAQEGVATRNGQDALRGAHNLVFFKVVYETEHHGTHGVLVEVHGETQSPVLELEQFVHCSAGETRHACDAVSNLNDASNLFSPNLRGVLGHVTLKRLGDFICTDGQFSHSWLLLLVQFSFVFANAR